jgi:hypothetical protein
MTNGSRVIVFRKCYIQITMKASNYECQDCQCAETPNLPNLNLAIESGSPETTNYYVLWSHAKTQ